jgi:hypothetical protein
MKRTCKHVTRLCLPPPRQPHGHAPSQTGEICLDILKTAWSPAWTLHSVCQAILALMSDPAPDSPLNCDAGEMGQQLHMAAPGGRWPAVRIQPASCPDCM